MFKPIAKGREIQLNMTTLKLYFDSISVEGLKNKNFYLSHNRVLLSKNVKIDLSNKSVSICPNSMHTQYLSMQNAVTISNCKLTNGNASMFLI